MDSPRTAGATLAALTFGFVVPLALGQSTTPEPAPARRAADVVVLHAFVTDASGAPVQGLGAGDFEVAQDGTPVPITGVLGPRPTRRGRSPSADPREAPILVVVLVDSPKTTMSLPGTELAKAETIANGLPWDTSVRVMVASGGDVVTVRQPFTAGPQPVLQALQVIEGRGEAVPGPEPGRARTSLASLNSFVESLGGLPGRKALLYVGGFPPTALSGAAGAGTPDPVRSLADRANAAGVAFYSLSAGPGVGTVAQRAQNVAPGAAHERAGGTAERLQPLLSATGGLAVEMSAGIADAIANVVRDLKGAYSLSFAAPSQGDGAMHQVRVTVRRGATSVRTRSAFRDLGDDDRMTERTLAALLFGVADNPLAIQVSATTEPNPKEGTQLVTVLVTIPLGNLAFEPRTVSHDCDLALWLAARDGEGHVTRAPKATFPVSVPNDRLLTALTQTAGYTFRVPLKPGSGTFAVTVRDEIAMQAATELTSLAPVAESTHEVTP